MKHGSLNPRSPLHVRKAGRYAARLRRALLLAAKRDSRKDEELKTLYETASVEGLDPALKSRKATVSFRAPFLRGTLHQIFDWHSLDAISDHELASSISWSLKESMRRWRR